MHRCVWQGGCQDNHTVPFLVFIKRNGSPTPPFNFSKSWWAPPWSLGPGSHAPGVPSSYINLVLGANWPTNPSFLEFGGSWKSGGVNFLLRDSLIFFSGKPVLVAIKLDRTDGGRESLVCFLCE